MSKKTFVKILSVFFCTLLIASLAIPCFADPLDLSEKNLNENVPELNTRTAGEDVFLTYVFDGSGRYDTSFSDSYSLTASDVSHVDICFGNGHFYRLSLTRGEISYDFEFSYFLDAFLYSCAYFNTRALDTFTYFGTLAFSINGQYVLWLGEIGIVLFDTVEQQIYTCCYPFCFRLDMGNYFIYFGNTSTDYLDAFSSTDDIVNYILSLSASDSSPEYSGGLFAWIEDHFLPLFGDIPTDEVDMGILGTWSPLQLVRAALWVSLGGVCVSGFVVLPFVLLLRLMGVKRKKR